MILRPPRSTRTATLFPYTTLFRSGKLIAYARETGVDVIGIDETVGPEWAARNLPSDLPVQGNLDPLALIAGGKALEKAVQRIISAFEDRPHIFNLGPGRSDENTSELPSIMRTSYSSI